MFKPLFLSFITPRWNRYMTYGVIGTIIGVLLTPILIGLPIMGLGFGLFSIGVMVAIVEKFPGGKRLINEYEQMFGRMFLFVRTLIREVTR